MCLQWIRIRRLTGVSFCGNAWKLYSNDKYVTPTTKVLSGKMSFWSSEPTWNTAWKIVCFALYPNYDEGVTSVLFSFQQLRETRPSEHPVSLQSLIIFYFRCFFARCAPNLHCLLRYLSKICWSPVTRQAHRHLPVWPKRSNEKRLARCPPVVIGAGWGAAPRANGSKDQNRA